MVVGAIAASLALLAAGCGGGSKAPSVASLGTTTRESTTAPSGSSPSGAGPPGPLPRGGSFIFSGAGVTAFSGCMRSHGVPDFPDPDSHGDISITASSGLELNSPRFRSAEQACQSLMPGPTPAEQARDQANALKYSACMRSHGVPNFPDPTFSNGNIGISARGLDANSPIFQSAQAACRHNLPGLP
jgi:hypothetical protein